MLTHRFLHFRHCHSSNLCRAVGLSGNPPPSNIVERATNKHDYVASPLYLRSYQLERELAFELGSLAIVKMRISRSTLFLLASATTVFSRAPLSADLASNFPTCAQPCINNAIQQYCRYDQTDECCCSTQAINVFTDLYICAASSSCTLIDVQNAISTGYTLCLSAGYDLNSVFGVGGTNSIPSGLLLDTTAAATATPSPSPTKSPNKTLSTGALVGIIVGALLVLSVIIGVTAFVIKRRHSAAAAAAAQNPPVTQQQTFPPPPPQAYPQYYPPPQPQPPYQQPLMGSYHELEQPVAYYTPKHDEPKQYIQELSSDNKLR